MTAPEAGSGPDEDASTLSPPGWRPVRNTTGATLLTLDRGHPDYLHDWQKRTEARDRQRLAAHAPLAARIESLRERFAGAASWFVQRDQDFRSAKLAGDDGAAQEIATQVAAVAAAFVDEAFPIIQAAALEPALDSIAIGTRMAYLAEQSLPEGLRLPIIARLADPFRILANKGPAAVPVTLFPGETSITFAGISSRELGATIAQFVTDAQEIHGHADRPRPGWKSNKDDPAKAEQARTAAKLHHWPSPAWSHAEIAELLGWQAKPASVEERVRLAIRIGEELLDDEMGPEWRFNPPKRIAERRC